MDVFLDNDLRLGVTALLNIIFGHLYVPVAVFLVLSGVFIVLIFLQLILMGFIFFHFLKRLLIFLALGC
jgi:hypothetical protein